jgi:hypothetical protein
MSSISHTHRLSITLRLSLAALLLISITISARQVAYYWSHGPRVSDLRIFMTGVEMVRSGQGRQLYQFDAQQRTQTGLYPETKRAGLLPFNHLAYELLLYWPVSRLPYRSALIAWAGLNFVLVFLIAWLMKPYTGAIRSATGIPIALYLLAFYPLLYVFGEGQDSLIFLLLVALSLRCAESRRMFLAGLVLALALFKFHLALLIALLVFLLRREWRAVGGFAAAGLLVAGISRLMVGPDIFRDYISMLSQQEVMTPWGFVPWFMPNLRGFLQWLLAPWLEIGLILPIVFMASAIVGIVGAWAVLRSRQDVRLLYAGSVLTVLLVSYHMHMQDLALASLPMLLLLDLALRREIQKAWAILLLVAVAALYGYRLAAETFPLLVVRGCLLALPLGLLWLVCVWELCRTPPPPSDLSECASRANQSDPATPAVA